jgi:hypothetical protein
MTKRRARWPVIVVTVLGLATAVVLALRQQQAPARATTHAAAGKSITINAKDKTVRNIGPGATFAPAPSSADPALTAQQAWEKYADQAGSAEKSIPRSVTARLGLLTWPVGPAGLPGEAGMTISDGEAYSSFNQLVYGYSWHECPMYSLGPGMTPPPPNSTPCIAWLFLHANTGNMIYQTWQQ